MVHRRFVSRTIALFLGISLVSGFFVSHTLTVSAQAGFPSASAGASRKVTVSPQYPKAFQDVTVTVEDYSQNIDTATISWSLNGKQVARGTGIKSYSFKTGFLGSVSTLTVSVNGSSETIAIRPSDIDLVWQSDSYVPPFYEGKALRGNQSGVRVVAQPFFLTSQGTRLDPANLLYTWKQNGKVAQASSGLGKQTFFVAPSVLAKPVDIEVEVSTRTGDYKSVARTTIEEVKPEVILYEDSPLYGVQTQASLNGRIFDLGVQPETTLLAVPFFFSTTDGNNQITYSWSQNGASINKKDNTVVFRAPTSGAGEARVNVSTKHTTNFMQGGNASVTVRFDKTQAPASGL